MDWVSGIPFGDTEAISNAGHNKKVLSERLLQVFLRQALNDGYFHADLHQGNMKISSSGDIVAYDFGIMGRIDEYTRRVYAEILIGFIKKDYMRVAEVHFEAGYVSNDQDINEFSQALRAAGEPIFGMDANQISMGKLLTYLFEVTQRFGMETRTELILLQRTMIVVEGVCRSLYPQINIWEVAQPVVQDYINKSVGPKALLNDIIKTGKVMARFGPKLPKLMEAFLNDQANSSKQKQTSYKSKKPLNFFVMGAFFGTLVAIGLGLI